MTLYLKRESTQENRKEYLKGSALITSMNVSPSQPDPHIGPKLVANPFPRKKRPTSKEKHNPFQGKTPSVPRAKAQF